MLSSITRKYVKMTDIELIPNPINMNTFFIFSLFLDKTILVFFIDFFTYNDRYDEENYEYDYPEEEGHQNHEEVKTQLYKMP